MCVKAPKGVHPITEIAKSLYATMVRLDPEPDDPEWDNLTAKEREFYELCVRSVLQHVDLRYRLADDDHVARQSHERE